MEYKRTTTASRRAEKEARQVFTPSSDYHHFRRNDPKRGGYLQPSKLHKAMA